MNIKAAGIIDRALDAYKRETGREVRVLNTGFACGNQMIDAVVELQGERFNVLVKKWAQQANYGALVYQVQQLPERQLLIADYINKKLAARLKAAGVYFIDTAGNAFVDVGNLYINVRGNDPVVTLTVENGRQGAETRAIRADKRFRPDQRGETGRAFTPTGMKVVYALVRDPTLIDQPYRKIAEEAGVALGTVGWAINDLKARRLVVDRGKNKRLMQMDVLIQKWVEAYPQLRQKYVVGNFVADDPDWWKGFNIQANEAQWGGEPAAALITGYLTPQTATIYTRTGLGKFIQAARLKVAVRGQEANVELLNPFWKRDEPEATVHPLIVYADLIVTGDPRNLETAKVIYERFIDKPLP